MLVLLVCSALISGAEVAYFSMGPRHRKDLEESTKNSSKMILSLLERPRRLLAAILIGNNLVNVGIIILSSFITMEYFDFSDNALLAFIIQVVAVTFLILLLGEVTPKVYATRHPMGIARLMAWPLFFMEKAFRPLSRVLIRSTSFIEKRIKHAGGNITHDELSHAIELTKDDETTEEEEKILKGIVRFGETDVKQIMKPRTDVVSFDMAISYQDLMKGILESGYSRIPVYKENFDRIEGVLYVKDLLPHLDNGLENWPTLLREPFFVPENKKIDDLLKEFQQKKMHLAIVVDEYGGNSGIITLEDIIEEIVGEITDEYDDEDLHYSKLDEHNYVFEGKTPLMDMYRILDIDGERFEDAKGESDTVAGFVVEVAGKIPLKNERINFEQLTFTVEAADRRKVKRVKVTLSNHTEEEAPANGKGRGGAASLLLLALAGALLALAGCEGSYTPKPRGYFRIDLPQVHRYLVYDSLCPFTFEYHENAFVDNDLTRTAEPCWLNITYPQYKGKVHLSYKKLEDDLRSYTEDARELVMKHTVRASAIKQEAFRNDSSRVFGLAYFLEGSAASSVQFWLTDSSTHYLRGALYFNVAPNPDSIAPVEEFIRQDIRHFMESFRWKP